MRSVLVYLLYWPMSLGLKPALLVDGTPNPESYIPTPNIFRLGGYFELVLCIFTINRSPLVNLRRAQNGSSHKFS